jgi:hypothetical protein
MHAEWFRPGILATLLCVVGWPLTASAVKFEIVPGERPRQDRVVALVEEGDTGWDIAGVAWRGVLYIGKGEYAAHKEWPAIYRDNPQIHNRPGNNLRPKLEDGGAARDDRHMVLELRPGDRLVLASPVNYEAMGLMKRVPVDEVVSKAEAIARQTNSLRLDADDRARIVQTFVKLARIGSPLRNEGAIREALKQMLVAQLGASVLLACGTECGGPKNLLVEFPAAGDSVAQDAIMLNAHMDTIEESTAEGLLLSESDGRFFDITEGSFGADDKAGLTVILGALDCLQHHYWSRGTGHRRIVVALTAEEECYDNDCYRGAAHLVKSHPDVFRGIAVEITFDGPIDAGDVSPFDPDNDFVVVVPKAREQESPFRDILATAAGAATSKGRRLQTTEYGLRWGDFVKFSALAKSDLHIRAPYEGDHVIEKLKIATLIDEVDLLVAVLLQ